ncbi:26S proteasome regulatory subunit N1 [Angomonas deanei]|nr:26S proteasome regulatory subunit N1 [Angomonas deanei]|eukprot:EPY29881.1 26S proteasome regulatory subunit N1 [Angomonas deanei]
MSERKPVEIPVPSSDPAKREEKKGKEEKVLSEEDEQIKSQVELLVQRSCDSNQELAKSAIDQLAALLQTSGSGSVASVPKPLKFVRGYYADLEQALKSVQDTKLIRRLRDVLSFVSMTLEINDVRKVTLEHKLKGTPDDLHEWGHEYLRFLAGCISETWKQRQEENESTDYLLSFVDQIMNYMISHQDESTALDLLIEVDQLPRIVPLVDELNYKRIASYAAAMSPYLTRPTNTEVLVTVYDIYCKMKAYAEAMVTALQLGDRERAEQLFQVCQDPPVRLQLALICSRQKFFIDFGDAEEDELLQEANGNMRLSQMYRYTAQELDSLAPKKPDEIFKSANVTEAKDERYNFISAFVSGLVNCGYGRDNYLTESETFLFEQYEDRIISTSAALGLIHLWDHTEGLQEIDKYIYSESNYVKAGACLALGITMCGIKNPFDPALGLLTEYVTSPQKDTSICAILGLGYAYSGTRKEEIKELLIPILADGEQSLEVQCFTAFALANVFVGSADEDITETMFNCLLEVPEDKNNETCLLYLILALGGMFLGCQEAADLLLEGTQTLPVNLRRYTEIVIRSCAFAGTGNVVIIQKLFHVIAESDINPEESNNETEEAAAAAAETKKKEQPLNHKLAAVLGIGLVAVGEPLGMEMAKRAIIHTLLADTVTKDKDSLSGRSAVPLVYALLSAGDPSMPVVETLNRLAHDSNVATAQNAILAMGIVSAGSNNARVMGKLKSLATYYQRKPVLFVVRLAMGLCAMGKGHVTLSPLLHNKSTISLTSLFGLLGILHSAMDFNKTILDKYHYMFFSLAPSIIPRMVVPVDENMEPVTGIQARVGLPVDTVAVPGKPKTMTGFQISSTPILQSAVEPN